MKQGDIMNISTEKQINFVDDLDEQLEPHFPKPDNDVLLSLRSIMSVVGSMELEDKIETINAMRLLISEHSPFKKEPGPPLSGFHPNDHMRSDSKKRQLRKKQILSSVVSRADSLD